jgi:hypothetical protein
MYILPPVTACLCLTDGSNRQLPQNTTSVTTDFQLSVQWVRSVRWCDRISTFVNEVSKAGCVLTATLGVTRGEELAFIAHDCAKVPDGDRLSLSVSSKSYKGMNVSQLCSNLSQHSREICRHYSTLPMKVPHRCFIKSVRCILLMYYEQQQPILPHCAVKNW